MTDNCNKEFYPSDRNRNIDSDGFVSNCHLAQKYYRDNGLRHWCLRCDYWTPIAATRCQVVVKKVLRYAYPECTIYSHILVRYHHHLHNCAGCKKKLPCWSFNAAQVANRATKRKCRNCQLVCPDKEREVAVAAAAAAWRAERANLLLTVNEKLAGEKTIYFLSLPHAHLVKCLTQLVENPPSLPGPHLLACKSVVFSLADLKASTPFPTRVCALVQEYYNDELQWIPKSGRYNEHKNALKEADTIVTVPADMCPTQVRLKKPVQRVDTSLHFVWLIVAFIMKENLDTETFKCRAFGPGPNNSVQIDKQLCAGGCGEKVPSCKALPYCPACICREMRDALSTDEITVGEPPKYNPMTNSVVDWARKALFNRFTRKEIQTAIGELVLSPFWKETVEFAMKYEMEVQLMRQGFLHTMCGICGGPCGIYSYFEKMADTVKCGKAKFLPWQEDHNVAKNSHVKNGKTFSRTGAPFSLAGGASPAEMFDFKGAAKEQIEKAQENQNKIAQNLFDFTREQKQDAPQDEEPAPEQKQDAPQDEEPAPEQKQDAPQDEEPAPEKKNIFDLIWRRIRRNK